MFDSKEEVKAAVDALWRVFGRAERGYIITWDAIHDATGVARDCQGWTVIKKFRRKLFKERNVITLCKKGVGIRLLSHLEAADEMPHLRQKKSYRQLNRGVKEVDSIDTSGLPDHLRMALSMQKHNMRHERLIVGRSLRDFRKPTNKTETLPVRKTS
jgi:hypothetical protein